MQIDSNYLNIDSSLALIGKKLKVRESYLNTTINTTITEHLENNPTEITDIITANPKTVENIIATYMTKNYPSAEEVSY